jgi:tRNA threonylcarbamoyladenosine biosynthesis protein TsaB
VEGVITLALDAATYHGSTALFVDGVLVAERAVAMRGREHEALMPAVAAVLAEAGIAVQRVERVVCGAGPGSFTSLRIAGSIAKGIALATGAELIPVSSLALIVASYEGSSAGRFVAVLDAMRGEHYVQEFAIEDGVVEATSPLGLVASPGIAELAAERQAIAVGPDRAGSHMVKPHAKSWRYITKLPEIGSKANLAEWEPAYGRLAEAQVKWEAANGRPLQGQ